MTIQIGDVLEASARMEFDDVDDQVNVYQFVLGTPGPLSDEQGVEDILTLLEALYTLWLTTMTLLTVFRDIRVTNVTQSEVLGTFPWPTLTNGLAGADALPPGNCGLVNFNTAVARVTPRKYMGSMTAASIEPDGTLTAGVVANLADVGTFLLTVYVGAHGDWLYGYESPKAGTFVFPVSATVTDISAYQRRRKQGRGS